jgi:hypothetical protein
LRFDQRHKSTVASAQDATYLATVTYNGNTLVVFEDEFGQLPGSPQAVLAYDDFPPDVDYPDGTVTSGHCGGHHRV